MSESNQKRPNDMMMMTPSLSSLLSCSNPITTDSKIDCHTIKVSCGKQNTPAVKKGRRLVVKKHMARRQRAPATSPKPTSPSPSPPPMREISSTEGYLLFHQHKKMELMKHRKVVIAPIEIDQKISKSWDKLMPEQKDIWESNASPSIHTSWNAPISHRDQGGKTGKSNADLVTDTTTTHSRQRARQEDQQPAGCEVLANRGNHELAGKEICAVNFADDRSGDNIRSQMNEYRHLMKQYDMIVDTATEQRKKLVVEWYRSVHSDDWNAYSQNQNHDDDDDEFVQLFYNYQQIIQEANRERENIIRMVMSRIERIQRKDNHN